MSDMPDNDSELSQAMDRILAFARKEMPNSIICIMSFTEVEWNGEIYTLEKISVNVEDRQELVGRAANLLHGFVHAPVYDRRTVN